jgi:hypothetical protein
LIFFKNIFLGLHFLPALKLNATLIAQQKTKIAIYKCALDLKLAAITGQHSIFSQKCQNYCTLVLSTHKRIEARVRGLHECVLL